MFGFFLFFSQQIAAQHTEIKSLLRVKCSLDSIQQYSLRLPSSYQEGRKYPVIIFLDPAARGDFPVEKYSSLADEYNLIIAGSFNSRNFEGQSSVQSFTAIFNDLIQRFSIDTQMILVAGFSGGSRAAAAIAMAYPQVTGVIACGAGFNGAENISSENLKAYAAIVGDEDMNFGELVDNSNYLEQLKINNILLTFSGGHEWPPITQLSLAFLWMTARPGKLNILSEEFASLIWKPVNMKVNSGFLYSAWLDAKQLAKIPILEAKASLLMGQVEKDKNFIADKNDFETVLEQEQNYMNGFSLMFNQLLLQKNDARDFEKAAWLMKAGELKQMRKDKDEYKQQSSRRCYDHSTRTCMEYFFLLMGSGEYRTASTVAEVLLCFDIDNSTPNYMIARAAAGMGNKKRSEKNLKEAIKKGLILNRRIEEDSLFRHVFTNEELRKLFEKK